MADKPAARTETEMWIHNVSPGMKIAVPVTPKKMTIFIQVVGRNVKSPAFGKSKTGKVIIPLHIAEARRLRDIIDLQLSGKYDQAAYDQIESEWLMTLQAAKNEITSGLGGDNLSGVAVAVERWLSRDLPPKTSEVYTFDPSILRE